MVKLKRVSPISLLLIIFVLILFFLFSFHFISLPAEFYSSFAGALAALVFSALISYYFWQKTRKQSKDTKAQIIQTLLSEIELNLNNIANFIKGCRDGTYFHPFSTALMQKNLFWPRFLTDYPTPSFELTQHFDLIYNTFFLMEFYAKDLQMNLPENLRFIPMTTPPLPESSRQTIRQASSARLSSWRFNIEASIGYYDKLIEGLNKEFKEYEFKKQLYFEQNRTYEKLRRFFTEI